MRDRAILLHDAMGAIGNIENVQMTGCKKFYARQGRNWNEVGDVNQLYYPAAIQKLMKFNVCIVVKERAKMHTLVRRPDEHSSESEVNLNILQNIGWHLNFSIPATQFFEYNCDAISLSKKCRKSLRI